MIPWGGSIPSPMRPWKPIPWNVRRWEKMIKSQGVERGPCNESWKDERYIVERTLGIWAESCENTILTAELALENCHGSRLQCSYKSYIYIYISSCSLCKSMVFDRFQWTKMKNTCTTLKKSLILACSIYPYFCLWPGVRSAGVYISHF